MDDTMTQIRANRERLWLSLMDLARIGAVQGDGSNRVALTDEDAEGQALFRRWAEEAACEVTRDRIGNLFARRAGADVDRAAVVVGSHLDTQPYGGRFDGPAGVLTGLEIVRTLNDHGLATEAPVVIAAWTNEEGARFPLPLTGSSVFAGLLDLEAAEAQTALDGPTFGAELRRLDLVGPEPIGSFAIDSYFELHIEQDTKLERAGADIGIVERGQGVRAIGVTLIGASSHAGTTAMPDRRDALVAAARVVEEANRIGHERSTLITVGRLEVRPNSRATVPGEVTLVIDIRDPEGARIDEAEQAIRVGIDVIAAASNVEATVAHALEIPVLEFDTACRDAVQHACETLGLSWLPLISGAGHDAMSIARIAPASLVFIPCRNGVSHHPAEYSSPDQVGAGCDTLLQAVLDRAGVV
jgi:beta-ureidopropionase / N-carbamoyl-L-amino-acid hydrolase